ncbi:MAG: ATP-binding protein [Candidatus Ventricola sp.]
MLPKEELNRLSSSIDRYDIQVHSGFEVLDVVLTEKMNLCLQRGIGMTCSLGQTDFSFLDEMDLYALFNNALTNAINAVSSMPEGQERYILLSTSQDNNIITIHVENPCNGDIQFVDGIPQTNRDPDWHGFGMKSMVRTAEKYGGALSASRENSCFQLDILLLNQTEAPEE